jgi:hypothetical protein
MVKAIVVSAAQCVLFAAALFGTYSLLARPASGKRDLPGGATLEILAASHGGTGRVYLATIPLDPAHCQLFVTPKDPAAPESGWTHRLRHTARVGRESGLTVAVNASMFAGGAFPVRREGEIAKATETTVADGRVISLWEHSYMLGFLPDLTPVPVANKPPPVEAMKGWAFGLSGQSWQAFDGRQGWWEQGLVTRRTVFGVNVEKRMLYLAVVDHATHAAAAAEIMAKGATHIFNLDGGESSTMSLNGKALTGDWRPVANHFGVTLR